MENENNSKKDSLKNNLKREIKETLKSEIINEIVSELKAEESTLKKELIEILNQKINSENIEQFAREEKQKKKQKSGKAPECYISVKAILKISSHALKYANENIPKEEWVEVIGLLAGRINEKNQKLYIEDAYPMGHGNAVFAEIKEYKNFVKAFKDIKRNGLFICGWYHSHPSYGAFMSAEDLGTQARYQKLWDKSVALVIDPYQIDGSSYGFKIFRSNLQTQKWYPIPFEITESLGVGALPELMEFIRPIIDGKALFLEYDEE
jgi:proteasome lid subunit RPN8/RPN11